MTAALETYTFATLQATVKREFGNPDDPSADFTALVKEKINTALALLWTEKPFWHFSLHPFAVNVQAKVTATGAVTQGDAMVTLSAAGFPSFKRREMRVENSQDAYVVKTHTAGDIQPVLDQPFTGSTSAASSLAFYDSYIALPADLGFIQMLKISSQWNQKLDFRHPWAFKQIETRSNTIVIDSWPRYYTVVRDPIHEEFDLQYLMLYPRVGMLTRIEGLYFATPLSLVDPTDTVPLPMGHRPAVIYKACSLIATQMGDLERAQIYEATAQRVMFNLMKANVGADDDDTEFDSPTGFDVASMPIDTIPTP